MTRGLILSLALLCSCGPARLPAAPPPAVYATLAAIAQPAGDLTLPAEVSGPVGGFIRCAATTKGDVVWWSPDAGLSIFPAEFLRDSRVTVVTAAAPGRYRLVAFAAADGKPAGPAVCTVVVGDPQPGPGPTPQPPSPPGPNPPAPLPIPGEGLRVLMIYETADVQKLPSAQAAVLYSKAVRDYLNAKCAVGPDGKTREYRIWDKDLDVSLDGAAWQAAMKRPRSSVPWIIVSDGRTGYEGPLPKDVESALQLLKKYGGQ